MNDSHTRKEILPAVDNNKPVNVEIGLKIRQIANVDEKNQVIRLILWVTLQWRNPYLMWDPAEYGGIESVHADHDHFWVPDLAVFNEAGFEGEIVILHKRLQTKLVITKDGNFTWKAPVTLNSHCTIDVADFPFDEQKCYVAIGSWTYAGHKIIMTYSDRNADTSYLIKSGEWRLQSASLTQNFRYYTPDYTPHPHITLTLEIKRRSLYYVLQIVVPLVLISLLPILTFILPPESEEITSTVTTIVVAISVYAIIISSALPETSDSVSVLQIYCLGILVTVVVTSVHGALTSRFVKLTSPLPHWFKRFINFTKNFTTLFSSTSKPSQKSDVQGSAHNKTDVESPNPNRNEDIEMPCTSEESSPTENNNRDTKVDENNEEWRYAALVVRRIFVVLYIVSLLGFNIYLLAKL
ncbi:acetylcholine receptor subunit alpha-like [Dendronephthya gigantea]|uniref:acetylcholine receptor subunit alpha-like n=1 Tax=Dendronephthya gigantea TaxID=151771 RepID=UPI0010691E7B|nr:acetylcholine receptor subunit alpha-like [Dendronephthya gigantea]